MSRTAKIVRNVAMGVAAFILVIMAATIAVVQSGWFRSYVKDTIVTATEDATGGRVAVGSFRLDLRHLRATLDNFVIHGKEPPGSTAYLQARQIVVDIRPLTSVHHILGIAYIGLDHPEANIIVF